MSGKSFYLFLFVCCMNVRLVFAQSTISFQCKELNISKPESLRCDPISEDDPNDLAEAYSYLISFSRQMVSIQNSDLNSAFPRASSFAPFKFKLFSRKKSK